MKISENFRVAVVHDWLTGYRGGEKVLEAILEHFPQAEIFTLVHKKGSTPDSIEKFPIRTSWIQKLPFGLQKYRHYLPLFPLAAETLVPQRFDVIISTSHAVAKSVRTYGRPHWCYIHSPMRYIWDRFDDYFGADQVGAIPSLLFFRPIAKILQWYDQITAGRVNHYVANSRFVAERVRNFYGMSAEVIAPPCEVEKFHSVERTPQDFYLFFSALVPYKKADHAIDACVKLGRKLVIMGNGPELEFLKQRASEHSDLVSFIPEASNDQVRHSFGNAKALLFPGVEDFGIVPVESIAAGLPVIGLKLGGLTDSMTDDTCLFYGDQTVEGLAAAIQKFESLKTPFSREKMKAQSLLFSKDVFKRKIESSLIQFFKTIPR